MKATKKLPVPINPKTGKPKSGGDFLVPLPAAEATSGFIGIKSGKRFETGALVYLGVPVTTVDIRERIAAHAAFDASYLSDDLLDAYLDALADFKLCNVLSVSYTPSGQLTLNKTAEHFPFGSGPRLP